MVVEAKKKAYSLDHQPIPVQSSIDIQASSVTTKPGFLRALDRLLLRMSGDLKTSNNPDVQERVEIQREKIMSEHLLAHPEAANQQARTIVAREIKDERKTAELNQTKSLLQTTSEESARYWRMATTDNMTDLHNERGFSLRLEQMLKEARDRNLPVTVLLIDLNGLKKVNDTYGHGAGDKYLKFVAEILKENQRQGEPAIQFSDYEEADGRIGGDEFGIVLKNVNGEGILQFWKRLSTRLLASNFELPNGQMLPIGAGAGYRVIMPEELAGLSNQDIPGFVESIKEITDRAMYVAKRRSKTEGYSRCELFNADDLAFLSIEERIAVQKYRDEQAKARDKKDEESTAIAAD